jgi:hypothetical protein
MVVSNVQAPRQQWWQAPKNVDYLADPRVHKLSFGELKAYLAMQGVEDSVLFYASTKFALIATAEKLGVPLEPLLQAPPERRPKPKSSSKKKKKKRTSTARKSIFDLPPTHTFLDLETNGEGDGSNRDTPRTASAASAEAGAPSAEPESADGLTLDERLALGAAAEQTQPQARRVTIFEPPPAQPTLGDLVASPLAWLSSLLAPPQPTNHRRYSMPRVRTRQSQIWAFDENGQPITFAPAEALAAAPAADADAPAADEPEPETLPQAPQAPQLRIQVVEKTMPDGSVQVVAEVRIIDPAAAAEEARAAAKAAAEELERQYDECVVPFADRIQALFEALDADDSGGTLRRDRTDARGGGGAYAAAHVRACGRTRCERAGRAVGWMARRGGCEAVGGRCRGRWDGGAERGALRARVRVCVRACVCAELDGDEMKEVVGLYQGYAFDEAEFMSWYDAHGEPDGTVDPREFGWYIADQAGCDQAMMDSVLTSFEETAQYVQERNAAGL